MLVAQTLSGYAALVGGGEVDRGELLGKGKPRVLEKLRRHRSVTNGGFEPEPATIVWISQDYV